ncbi:MAG TPA: hypothetical protein P5080_00055 [Candidatus Paceibacterota bacterium]|nr:hypothetical protein [Candidatus Pacearchaeota archaeon]HRZ50366.1 hypothetical protein [Candidatus Paceibacterota bacterium]HSA36087.1 hypothetical protein [Candidatus Paceibacterota bacterium]
MIGKINLYVPAAEWFLSPANLAEAWPKDIAASDAFLAKIKSRQELRERFERFLQSVPCGMSVEESVQKGMLGAKDAEKIYLLFAELLADNDYQRLVLYLPFELLPANSWRPGNGLGRACKEFRQAYLEAWSYLLSLHDVAANFRDGDIVEVSTRTSEPERVVKAAHLAPMLIKAGMISTKDLVSILEQSQDTVLKNSLVEALMIANTMGLIFAEEIKAMEKSGDRFTQSVAFALQLKQSRHIQKAKRKVPCFDLKNLGPDLEREYRLIEQEDFGNVTAKRKAWLIGQKKQECNKKAALQVKEALLSEHLELGVLRAYASGVVRVVLIEGIREAIEFQARTDTDRARQIFACLEPVLESLWDKNNPEEAKAIFKALRRLANLGVVDGEALKKFGIPYADLGGPFSKNLSQIAEEVAKLEAALASIAADETLFKSVYPVIMAYGSRLKRYGAQNADIDLAIFVKPEADYTLRPLIQELLERKLKDNGINSRPVEFWLKAGKRKLEVIDFQESDAYLGESWWVHILFGAAWLGQEEAVGELRQRLLIPYLWPTDVRIDGCYVRRIYLEELERDCLLYRLAHRGYYEFYPPAGQDSEFFRELDGDSAFWDAGYRRLATRLYLANVFLPELDA